MRYATSAELFIGPSGSPKQLDSWPPRSTGWSCSCATTTDQGDFGKYIDPRVVEGLIDRPNLTAAGGQRRVFCDLKGFTSLSEGMTPQGLVKVMNRYLSIMSEPIRTNRGIIDKYIGDGIMA
jgi:class 3 adenylate cyclase